MRTAAEATAAQASNVIEGENATGKPAGGKAQASNVAEGENATGKPAGGKRGPRGPRGSKGDVASGDENVLYCIEDPNKKGESGNLVLMKPAHKKEILAACIKHGVHYFRLQKFTASVELGSGGKYEIVEVPVVG
jgi:hypothetical protein